MKCFVFVCLNFLSLWASEDSFLAVDKLALGIGKGQGSVDAYKLSLRQDADLDFFKDKNWGLDYQCALSYWQNDRDDAYAFSVAPILSYSWLWREEWQPYVEFGVGVTYVSEKVVDTRQLGTHFQFEDQFALGLRYGAIDLSLQYIHYSNAGLDAQNAGLDIGMVNFTYHF